jgi:hypothetical protein
MGTRPRNPVTDRPVTALAAMDEHSYGMQAALMSRFADSGGSPGRADAQGPNLRAWPSGVEQALCR